MSTRPVIGAGAIAACWWSASSRGDRVRPAPRNGTLLPDSDAAALDAKDADAVTRAAEGASRISLCTDPHQRARTADRRAVGRSRRLRDCPAADMEGAEAGMDSATIR